MIVADVGRRRRSAARSRACGAQTSRRWSLTVVAARRRCPRWTPPCVRARRSGRRRRIRTRGRARTGSPARRPAPAGPRRQPAARRRADLPRRRLGARRRRPPRRRPRPDGRRLRRRGPGDAEGTHVAPRLKPDYSPDFLLSSAYVGRPLAVGSALAGTSPRSSRPSMAALGARISRSHACEAAEVVTHIPEVLCHRTRDAGPLTVRRPCATVTGRSCAGAAMRRGRRRARPPAPSASCGPPRPAITVSILIPFRDEPRFLRTCVDSIAATTEGARRRRARAHRQRVLGPRDPDAGRRLAAGPDVRVLSDPRPFNWAELNNAAARRPAATSSCSSTTTSRRTGEGWLAALCAQALRPDVGAAGARLLYPDRRLQHCGLVVGLTGAAGHPLAGLPPDAPGYLHMAGHARECAAVTGACLATRREVFDQLERLRRDARRRSQRRRLLPARRASGVSDHLRARGRADPPRVARAGARPAASATSSSSSIGGRITLPTETATSTLTSPARTLRADWRGPKKRTPGIMALDPHDA